MTCSARSLGSASNSCSRRRSSSAVLPRGRVPAMGRISTWRSSQRTWVSGDAPDQRKPLQFQQKHVGRRIDGAGGAVNVQRRRLDGRGETLRADDLDDVAGGDVFLGRSDICQEGFLGHVGLGRAAGGTSSGASREVLAGLFQQRNQALDFAHRVLVRLAGVAPSSMIALTRMVMVCATRSKISSSSAMRKYMRRRLSSSRGGRGTTGSMSWMNS